MHTSSPNETEPSSLSRNLETLLREEEGTISIRSIVERIGDKGFGVLLVVLSLPSALPVPAPGYSTPFGILLALLALQMILGRQTPWLPERALKREIRREAAEKLVRSAQRFLRITEKLIRPRCAWIQGRAGRMFQGFVILAMAVLMIFPIPLTNTAPAGVIFLAGIALSEDDGILAVLCFGLGLLAVAFYAYVVYLLLTVGVDGVMELKDWLKERLFG